MERERPLDEDEKSILRFSRAFEPMLRSEGWHFYRELLTKHIEDRQQIVNSASTSIEAVLQSEGAKGALAGLRLALQVVDVIVEQAKAIRIERGEDEDA